MEPRLCLEMEEGKGKALLLSLALRVLSPMPLERLMVDLVVEESDRVRLIEDGVGGAS